jgi:hypothetical protein
MHDLFIYIFSLCDKDLCENHNLIYHYTLTMNRLNRGLNAAIARPAFHIHAQPEFFSTNNISQTCFVMTTLERWLTTRDICKSIYGWCNSAMQNYHLAPGFLWAGASRLAIRKNFSMSPIIRCVIQLLRGTLCKFMVMS